jgi:hypothetical protein
MKDLFDSEVAAEIKGRIQRTTSENERVWGTMTLPQALAHCSVTMEVALGESTHPRMFIGRIIGRPIKWLALRNDAPVQRNSPTVPEFVVRDERDLDVEKERLIQLVDRFATGGAAGCTKMPHSFFGRMTPKEWSGISYKHLDHHLRQFSA